ncbi:hypothetical protein CTA1_2384 [Colletotrichum tanaceti]|uniref:Uncharacterized protein n=1 Tax=Colletotrichum tanaceti TaxID=1306861 RepID=A0A4V6Y9D5_9PEZI|nr:hypothetical protein CTA1_2384 [Colletotrichum tanaceti]
MVARVVAPLDDLAVGHDEDDVGVLDGGEAVGDHDHGAAALCGVEDGLDAALGLAVEGAGGLVEQQQRGPADEGAGDGDALLLAAREGDAGVADLGVVALGQGGDEVVDAGVAGGGVQGLVRHGGLVLDAQQHVLADGAGEEVGLLRDEGDVLAVVHEVERLDVVAVVEDLAAGLEGVEALEQGDHGRLAGPRGAHDGRELPALDAQVEALEHRQRARRVAEPDVLELDLHPLLVVDLVRHDVADALEHLVLVVVVLPQREDAVGGCLCLCDRDSPENESHAEKRDAVAKGKDHDGEAGAAEGVLDVVVEQVVVALADAVLHGQAGDGADGGDALRGELCALGEDGVVGLLEARLVADAVEHGGHDDGHGGAERHERELPAEDEPDHDAADDVEERDEHEGHVGAQELLQHRRVRRQPRRQRPGRVALGVEEGRRLVEDVAEVLLSVHADDALLILVGDDLKKGAPVREEGDQHGKQLAEAAEHAERPPPPETAPRLLDDPQRAGLDALELLVGAVHVAEVPQHAGRRALAAGPLLREVARAAAALERRLADGQEVRLGTPPAEVAKEDVAAAVAALDALAAVVVAVAVAHVELLRRREQVVRPVLLRHEGLVRALLDDLALAQQDDVVGLADGAEAVGDDDGRAALAGAVERRLHDLLAAHVDGRRRLVEDEDLGLLDDGPGDGEPLPLAARELDAGVADFRLVALLKMSPGLDGLRLVLPLGPDEAVLHVLVDGRVEEGVVLLDQADLATPPLWVDLAQEAAADADETVPEEKDLGRVTTPTTTTHKLVGLHVAVELVPPLEDADDGALAGARGPDDGRDLAGRERDEEVVEDLDVRALRVDEVDGLEDDVLGRRDLGAPERAVRLLRRVDDGVEDGVGVGRLRRGLQGRRDLAQRRGHHHDAQEDAVFPRHRVRKSIIMDVVLEKDEWEGKTYTIKDVGVVSAIMVYILKAYQKDRAKVLQRR